MGLSDLFIRWIYLCIFTVSFSVQVNGALEGFFTSAHGIHQCCCFSPYLYVILNNVLSKQLNQAAIEGLFGYHPRCSKVNLTHLIFAIDILVFTDGSETSLDGFLRPRSYASVWFDIMITYKYIEVVSICCRPE